MVALFLSTVGTDYNAVNQTLVFNADASRVCFDTSPVVDDLLEDDEVYHLMLDSFEPGLTLDPSETTVTIEDDDRKFYTLCIVSALRIQPAKERGNGTGRVARNNYIL